MYLSNSYFGIQQLFAFYERVCSMFGDKKLHIIRDHQWQEKFYSVDPDVQASRW